MGAGLSPRRHHGVLATEPPLQPIHIMFYLILWAFAFMASSEKGSLLQQALGTLRAVQSCVPQGAHTLQAGWQVVKMGELQPSSPGGFHSPP